MVGHGRLSSFGGGGDERQVEWSGGRGGGAVYDLHGGLVDVQRVDDLQLGPGRRLRRRSGRVGPAGYPQELLDLQSHPAGLAAFLLLASGRPFGGQRERGRLALFELAAAAAVLFRGRTRPAVRVAVPVAVRRLLFHFDLFAVLGQQFAVIDGGHVAGPGRPIVGRRAVVGGGDGTGVLSDDDGRLFRRAALDGRRGRRWRRFRRLPFDAAVAAPGTLWRAVTGHRSTLKYGRKTETTINTSKYRYKVDATQTHTHDM